MMAQLRSGTRSTSLNQILRCLSNVLTVVTLSCVHDGLHSTQLSVRFFNFLKRKKICYTDVRYASPWMVQLLSSVLMGSSCVFLKSLFHSQQALTFFSLYLIPGASAKLELLCLGGHNLLLMYADHRCRLWDVRTKEFWRSMSLEKAQEMLDQGGWTRM